MARRCSPWQALLLALVTAAFLLPTRGMQARNAPNLSLTQPTPDRDQLLSYEQGRRAWEAALKAHDPEKKAKAYACAQNHLALATEGVSHFPEAWLALGLLYYHRDDVYHAEQSFETLVGKPGATGITRGALRAEGLVYAGVLALRRNAWVDARTYFTAALAEDLGATLSSAPTRKSRDQQVAVLKDRASKLRTVAQVGGAMAVYYQAVHPADPAPGAVQFEAAGAAARELEQTSAPLDGQSAALWRFPELLHVRNRDLPFPVRPSARVDWKRTLDRTVPNGVAPVSPLDFTNSVRTYAAASLEVLRSRGPRPAQLPALDLPTSQSLTVAQDRRNAAMGWARRLMWQLMNTEGVRPDYPGAAATLRQLAAYADVPGVALTVRQHGIWLALEGLPDAGLARTLIYGPGAAGDPILYNEIYSLGQMLLKSRNDAAAVAEWRKIVAGVTESGDAAIKADQTRERAFLRPYAEANIAAWSLNSTGNESDPAFWRNALAAYPSANGREELRFFLALRWGAAVVAGKAPAADLQTAMKTAQDLAAGRSGGRPQEGRDHDLTLWYRYLAHLADQGGSQATYAGHLAALSDYHGEHLAYRASQAYADWAGTGDPSAWPGSIRDLMVQARDTVRTPGTRAAYERTIQDIDTFLSTRGVPGRAQAMADGLNEAWAQAVKLTGDANAASRARQWAQAAGLWDQSGAAWTAARTAANAVDPQALRLGDEGRAVLKIAQEDATGLVAQSAFKKAEAVFHTNRAGVGAALDAADQASGADAASQRVKSLVALARRAGDGRPAGLGSDPGHWVFRAYTGGRVPARTGFTAVVRYPAPHNPDVARWLARLRNPQAGDRDRATGEFPIDKLVKWFNAGYGGLIRVRNARGASRPNPEHVRTGWTRETLLAYLEQNVRTTPGRLPQGSLQYGYRGGRWFKGRVTFPSAAYYLKNGRAIINAQCSNPLDVILEGRGAPGWPPMTPVAYPFKLQPPVVQPVAPLVAYRQPNAGFDFAQYGYYDIPTHSAGYFAYSVCPGGFSLLIRAQMPPKLPVPEGVWVPPHCSPARITIGRVSTEGARDFPLRVEMGTAESRRR